MKKLGLAVAVATAMGATSAVVNAYNVGEYDNGLLVPYAAIADGTAVGLMTCWAGNVAWTYFDENTKHITDGVIPMTKNDMYSFIFSREAGIGLEAQKGYLVFVLDTEGKYSNVTNGNDLPDGDLDSYDNPCLAGNSFQLDVANQDVHFQGIENVSAMDNDSLTALAWGAWWGDIVSMRYYIDNQPGGNDTKIFVWSVCKPPVSNTVNMYDDNEKVKSVNILLPNDELNIIDPETILGRPATFLDGFINWEVAAAQQPDSSVSDPAYCDHGRGGPGRASDDTAENRKNRDYQGVVSWSFIYAPAFGAAQTLINPHTWDHWDMD
jgi:hypothetical protein